MIPLRVLLPCLFLVTSCRSRTSPAPASAPPVAESAPTPGDAGSTDADRAAREAAAREARMRAERETIRVTLTAPILFAFDRSDLTSAARATLEEKLAILRRDASISLRIEGHADERGSSEYNLALGMRRAAAARRFFILAGIPADRITVTSFGEERPLCMSANEACWRVNRRDEFSPGGP